MTRREFSLSLAGLAGVVSGGRSKIVTLNAIAGVRLPATLAIATTSPEEIGRGLWELRTYRTSSEAGSRLLAARLRALLPGAGIHPALESAGSASLTYLIPFEDLTARDRAWTTLTSDPAWTGAQFHSYHFSLYSVA
ncbi:MAG TPA: hypothetical protein VLN48_06655 [Bryobacteraceae bacterium]|nr:hypothetical protein [Bryobacteraceae bacterium]